DIARITVSSFALPEVRVVFGRWLAAVSTLLFVALSSPSRGVAAAQANASEMEFRTATLQRYCFGCHSEKTKSGGLALSTLDPSRVGADAEVWEKVIRKLRGGVMPPPGSPRPDSAVYARLISSLENGIDKAAAMQPLPGRKDTFHRLNRTEYQN